MCSAGSFAQHWEKLLADSSKLKKTIVVDDQVVGNIGSWTAEGKREIGYWIDRAFWGRGIGTEALSAFLRLEKTRPLYAGVAKHNAASIRVLQKCGFILLGFEDAANEADATHVLLRLDALEPRRSVGTFPPSGLRSLTSDLRRGDIAPRLQCPLSPRAKEVTEVTGALL